MSSVEMYILSQKGNNIYHGGVKMTAKWKQKDKNPLLQRRALIHYFAKVFNLDPLTVQLLFERKMDTEERISAFLFPSIHQFHSPFLFNDMKKGVKRIIEALKQKEQMIIFGDYDVDGMSSTALLGQALRFFGGNVELYVPLREEGYGLSASFVKKINEKYGRALIITVDNGSSSMEAANYAKACGIDLIITDHHEVLGEHPPCVAFINPKRKDNVYPFSGLSGAGVALKVVQALFEACNRPWSVHMWDYLELACLGTVADMMPLSGENRAMVSFGVQKLNNQPSLFFKELMRLLYLPEITSSDISFRLAPVLNSSGRIHDPNFVVRLLTSPLLHEGELESLLHIDKVRKNLTETQFQKIEKQIMQEGLYRHPIIVVHGEYEEGIMGILAARITNKWQKPSIVISQSGKASCRGGANPNFSMIQTIESSRSFLNAYGGHKQAAGFSIDPNQIEPFRAFLLEQTISNKPVESIRWYDSIIQMDKFPTYLWDELSLLEPFGMGNEKPIFFSPNTKIESVQYFGAQKQYFKCQTGIYEALSFQKADAMRSFEERQFVDFLYTMGSNQQFLVEDISIDETRNAFLNAM